MLKCLVQIHTEYCNIECVKGSLAFQYTVVNVMATVTDCDKKEKRNEMK